MQYNESFLKGSIPKALIKFAIPLMIANILQILYTTVDMYIVGQFAQTADVSAVATAGMVMTCITFAIS
ncbi:MAG: MATE family efflux transporter, partial [Oscillospiraceae bacterium]|nr:MATE family efflux transporter [Oscillospiraceae bacterium]